MKRKKKRTGRSDVFQELLQLAFHAAIELYRALSGSLKDPKGLTMGHREKFDSPDFSKHQWILIPPTCLCRRSKAHILKPIQEGR